MMNPANSSDSKPTGKVSTSRIVIGILLSAERFIFLSGLPTSQSLALHFPGPHTLSDRSASALPSQIIPTGSHPGHRYLALAIPLQDI